MKSLEKIYTEHNIEERGRGFVLFGQERGECFSKWIGRGKRILDLGCRDCALTKYYCKGNEILGVDIDRGGLEICEKELGIETKWLDLNEDWELEKESFDVAMSNELLEHLYYPKKVIKKIHFVLKPEGMLIGSVPNAFSLANRIRLFLGEKSGTPLEDSTHLNHFSYKELKNLLEEDFKEVKLIPLTRFRLLGKISPSLFSFLLLFRCQKPK